MDEPTSSLSGVETQRLFAAVRRVAAGGAALIYISHFLEEVASLADRFTVLRDGKRVDAGDVPREPGARPAFVERLLRAMTGRPLRDAYPKVSHSAGPAVLTVHGLTGARLPRDAELTIHSGEVLGIAGLVGSGRTELLRALFGLDPVRGGSVVVAEPGSVGDETRTSPWRRLAQGIGLLSEARKEEGLALELSIEDNVTLSCLERSASLGILRGKLRRQRVREIVDRLGVRYADVAKPVRHLSGGNQQKVALGRLLHHDVRVLLLDEPTRGIDVASKAEIYRVMGELAGQGKAIVFVSSYLPELLGVCDRIAVMHRGRLGVARPRAEWTEQRLLAEATLGARD
jgi:ribose transport system ATP-binding protein